MARPTLPDASVPWPPQSIRDGLQRMDEWSAWWSGEPDELIRVYDGESGTGGPKVRPAQWSGGVVGKLARFWWGRPPAAHEPRAKLHIPVASDLCRAAADLLYSEPVKASLPESAPAKVKDRLDALLDDGMHARLIESAEAGAALGGSYLRPVWDKAVSDKVWLHPVHADQAVPTFRWGRLVSVIFWRVVADDGKQKWRHLELHTPGWVEHALYRGDGDKLGQRVPLEECEATAPLAALVNSDSAIATGYRVKGVDRLAVWYLPAIRPNRLWRRHPVLAPYGRSVLQGVEGPMDALDEVYSSWMRDLRLGKGRITVPETYLEDHGPGRGATFDPDREAYSALPGMVGNDDTQLTVTQFAIRTEEHDRMAQTLLKQILRTAGFSPQSFGEDGSGQPITAREVIARGQLSYVTKSRMELYQRAELAAALEGLLAVDAHVFGTGVTPAEVTVEYSDGVADDLETLAGTVEVLERARSASIETRVRMLHPEWGDDAVAAEVEKIKTDLSIAMPDPFEREDEEEAFERQMAADGEEDPLTSER